MSSEHDKRKNLFQDMQLPDMEKSWEQMKQKLQEDKDRRKPLFYWPQRNTAILFVLVFLAAGAGWWFLADRNKTKSGDMSSSTRQYQLPVSVRSPKDTRPGTTVAEPVGDASTQNSNPNINNVHLPDGNAPADKNNLRDQKSSDLAASSTNAVATPITRLRNKNQTNRLTNGPTKQRRNNTAFNDNSRAKFRTRIETPSANEDQQLADIDTGFVRDELLNTDSVGPDTNAKIEIPAPEMPTEEMADTTSKKSGPTAIASPIKPSPQKPKKSLQFSLGLGLQQQVPLGAQSGIGYNYFGRSNTFSDHLPSVYARMEKPGKWFLDAEFHYGSPQLLESFSYSRQTSLQDSGTVLSTNSLNIEKTYYHKVPLSLNIYVKPRWSVGTGFEYSLFYGAISRKTTTNKNLLTGLTGTSSEMVFVKQFNDSFLYKSQLRLLVQSMYQWKRFNFGLRYSADLEPYIRFTTPEGVIKDRRSNSLQLLVRYRLF